MKGFLFVKKDFLLFDLDGTIIDSQNGILDAVQYTLRQFGTEEKRENLYCYIGPPILDSLMRFHHFSLADAQQAVPVYRSYYAQHGMKGNLPFPGVVDMLQAFLDRRKVLAIATSKPVEVAVPILEDLGLATYFSFIGGSSLSGERPHKVDVIRHVLDQLNIKDLEKAVMIGDRCYDILGAKQAGISSAGILYGYGSRKELEEADADKIAATPADLIPLMEAF